MRRIFRILGALVALSVIAASVLVARVLYTAGYFNKVASGFGGKCEQVTGVVGAEDIEIDRRTGVVFISAVDRRPADAPDYLKPGAIYLARYDTPGEAPKQVYTAARLHPHGISLFADATGGKTLAVINHPQKQKSEVLLFDVVDGPVGEPSLTLRRTIADPLLSDLNDITLVDHEKFYATNDHGSQTALGRQLEDWLLLPRANVVYYDGTAAETAAAGLNLANGINRSANASEIYVAETTGRQVSVFHRDAATGALSRTLTIAIPMGLDNIDVDASGDLWIGAHPRLLDFLGHFNDPAKLSPSAVVKVHLEGEASSYEPIYLNTGEEISGSSVAAYHGGRLLIGAVLEPKYLNCALAK